MLAILLLLLVCAFFTASELAFVACDRIKLKSWASRKIKGAEFTLNFLDKPDKFLITVLVGINLTVAGLGVVSFKVWYAKLPELLIALFVALFVLIFGEILPKVLVSKAKEQFTIISVRAYIIIYWLFYPLIFIAHQSSIGVLRLFGVQGRPPYHKFTREELQIALKHTLPLKEQDIVARIPNFRKKGVKDIMIPKSKIQAAEENSEVKELRRIISKSGYSRIPIYQTTIDQIIGLVDAKTLLQKAQDAKITGETSNLIKPCLFVSETRTLGGCPKMELNSYS